MSVSEDVRTFLFRVFLELLLLFQPLLQLISSLEPRSTLVIRTLDGVLILNDFINLALKVFQLVCFFDQGVQSVRDCFKRGITVTSL